MLISGTVQHLVVCWQPSISWHVAISPHLYLPLHKVLYLCAVYLCTRIFWFYQDIFTWFWATVRPHLNCLSSKPLFPKKVTFIGLEGLNTSIFWREGHNPTHTHCQRYVGNTQPHEPEIYHPLYAQDTLSWSFLLYFPHRLSSEKFLQTWRNSAHPFLLSCLFLALWSLDQETLPSALWYDSLPLSYSGSFLLPGHLPKVFHQFSWYPPCSDRIHLYMWHSDLSTVQFAHDLNLRVLQCFPLLLLEYIKQSTACFYGPWWSGSFSFHISFPVAPSVLRLLWAIVVESFLDLLSLVLPKTFPHAIPSVGRFPTPAAFIFIP